MKLKSTDLICKKIRFLGRHDAYVVLPPESNDPIVNEYYDDRAVNDYMLNALELTTKDRDLVVDLGCHVGTFSIGAAALGRSVVAVDANPKHVDWVRKAAQINGFEDFSVINNAISTSDEPVSFIDNGLFGAIDFDRKGAGTLTIDTVRLDKLIQSFSKGRRVSFLKMDIEGAEHQAIMSAGNLLQSDRPVIWFESNGPTLEAAGSSVPALRSSLEEAGYKVYRVEGEEWVYAPPDQIQPEAWVDMIALSQPDQKRWQDRLRTKWADSEILARCEFWASLPHANTKSYLAEEIRRREVSQVIAERLHQIAETLQPL